MKDCYYKEENLSTSKISCDTKSNAFVRKFEDNSMLDKVVFNKKRDLYVNLDDKDKDIRREHKKCKTAWLDCDDEIETGGIFKFLTNKYEHLQASPKWAKLGRKVEEECDGLLQSVGYKSSSVKIPPNTVEYKRLRDLNRTMYAEGAITSVQFHPTSTVGLVAGYSGVLSLYAVDGIKNEKLHNTNFKDFPIKCCQIYKNGQAVIIGSSKKYYYTIDLITAKETRGFLPDTITKLSLFDISKCDKFLAVAGRFGEIHLMDAKSKELIHTYKQKNQCTGLQILSNSEKIFSHSNSSEVTIFDIRKQRIEHEFIDDGCVSGKTISTSPNCRIIATGSNEGIVNIYDYADLFSTKMPKPIKIINNLVTSINVIKFNPSSELLGISSDMVPGAFKLVNFPSASVYSNFPGLQANIGHVTALDFSPNSGFMVIGNHNKAAPLFRLKHFKNY